MTAQLVVYAKCALVIGRSVAYRILLVIILHPFIGDVEIIIVFPDVIGNQNSE